MNKFKDILICTDLDGTLLGSNRRISRENIEAIEYFKSEGGFFTFITGRMPSCVCDIYEAVKPNVPFGCVNGGGLYDGERKKYIKTFELSRDVLELLSYVDEHFPKIGMQVNTFQNIYFPKNNEAMQYFRDITGMPNLERGYGEISEPFAKIVFGDSDAESISRLAEVLPRHPLAKSFSFTRSEKFLFEILPNGINKATALGELCKYLDIPISKSIALGDYDNDVEMLKAAGTGIAVANGTASLKAVADLVTVSNDEHAVAKVIYDTEAGKIALT